MANAIAGALRRRGIDVLTPHEAGRRAKMDEEQLAFANGVGRVMVTADEDYLRLHASGAPHAGIAFLSEGWTTRSAVRGLIKLHAESDAESMRGRVWYLKSTPKAR